jgi:hypothetical protein
MGLHINLADAFQRMILSMSRRLQVASAPFVLGHLAEERAISTSPNELIPPIIFRQASIEGRSLASSWHVLSRSEISLVQPLNRIVDRRIVWEGLHRYDRALFDRFGRHVT